LFGVSDIFSTVSFDMDQIEKFIRFTKVDSVKREVSGIVTAEQPDKDRELWDYVKSKPYYQAWSDEFRKSTEGKSLGNLLEMHGLSAVGKAIDLRFNDSEKEIEMPFKVVDDGAWRKVDERVYTGFSQGGRKVGDQVPDPVHKGCVRYMASPSVIPLVDNPCLPDAHFAYVKADGSVVMRKLLKTETSQLEQQVAGLTEQVNVLKKTSTTPAPTITDHKLGKEKRTKLVSGKNLPSSAFAYVGDPERTETWKFSIHDASHVRNALARRNQAKGIPASEKAKVRAKGMAKFRALHVPSRIWRLVIAFLAEQENEGDEIRSCGNCSHRTFRIWPIHSSRWSTRRRANWLKK
jgi:hypothetical protein